MKKELYLDYFKDKKITVMGLGLLGRGIGDTAFLASCGADLIVTDKKTDVELRSSKETLNVFPAVTYHLGGHTFSDFEQRDCIVKAAGVPYDSEYIAYAQKNDVPVYMSAALVCKIVMEQLPDVVIIGITGTRGKTTTTELIAHILKENNSKIHLGGNIRGVANLPLLESIEDGEYLVLELDSWQLQGFRDLGISPHIAVFTSFMDDHMNYYKNDRELYFNDKAAIYRNQKEGDVCIASKEAAKEIVSHDVGVEVIVPEVVPLETKILGEHNQVLASLAYEVGTQCGLDDESIRAAIATFPGVEGRLQDIGTVRGVHVFNDNNATTGDATTVALQALYDRYKKKPILIMGGTDKGLSLDAVEGVLQKVTKEVVYISGTGTSRLSTEKRYEYEKLEECIEKAFSLAEEGDIILFSPGFASFSQFFHNEYERNDVFLKSIDTYR